MSISLIQSRLDGYRSRSTIEEEQALREITQELILAGLARSDFFSRAAFQGGTCLRIFHGLNRFSEDLDFALDSPNSDFELTPYLQNLRLDLEAYGYRLEIDDRSKAGKAMQHAFLKDDSLARLLKLEYQPRTGPPRKLRVKLEVDTNPPAGASYEMPFLDFPFPSAIKNFDLPSLFAGKLHALLCREFVKGRDWYDLIWYVARRTPVNHQLLTTALAQEGPWRGESLPIDDAWCRLALHNRVEQINFHEAARDVERFVKKEEIGSLSVWSQEYFHSLGDKLGS